MCLKVGKNNVEKGLTTVKQGNDKESWKRHQLWKATSMIKTENKLKNDSNWKRQKNRKIDKIRGKNDTIKQLNVKTTELSSTMRRKSNK